MKALGDKIYWVESSTSYGKYVPCTICFGKLHVTLILGDGSQMTVECDFCKHGLDEPRGKAKTWEPAAFIRSGTISGISTRNGIQYEVGHTSLKEHEVFSSEQEAEPVYQAKLKEVTETAAEWFKNSFVTCTKKQTWSAGYHKSRIKDAERTISWHQARLAMIENKLAQKEHK